MIYLYEKHQKDDRLNLIQPNISRRTILSLMMSQSTIAVAAPVLAKANSVISKTPKAINGYQFMDEGNIYQLADIIGPQKEDLNINNRQYEQFSKAALNQALQTHAHTVNHLDIKNRWGIKIVRLPLIKKNDKQEKDRINGNNYGYMTQMLLAQGHGRVNPQSDDHEFIQQLLQIEDRARQKQKGLWALKWYRVRNANELDDARDSVGGFHVFSGVVKKVGAYKGRRFLNFGEDYNEDVTATISSRDARKWIKNDFDFEALEGQRIRFRGVAEWINGPSIALTHSQTLEILQQ